MMIFTKNNFRKHIINFIPKVKMKNCLFCNLKEDYIYENNYFYAMFDVHAVSPWHTLIIPKRHVLSILYLNKEEWESLHTALKETISIIESTDFIELYKKIIKESPTPKSTYYSEIMLKHTWITSKPEWYNIGNNDWEVAWRTIHHLHIQVIPRYKWDVKDPTWWIRNIIPWLGNYKK